MSTRELSIEIADWAKKYTANMADVKTRLTKVTKRCGNEISLETSYYRELFEEENEPASKRSRRSRKCRKILVRGCTGIGKSVLAKKIAVDWVNEEFTTYDIVIYIPVSMVKPKESVRTILTEHTGMSDETLQEVLRGNSLFIIDDLCTLNYNKNLMKLVADPAINVLVTDTSSVRIDDMGINFDTICTVKGFQDPKLQAVQGVEVSLPSVFEPLLQSNPLLAIVTSYLIEKKQLKNTSANDDESISLSEVYFRLVKCLIPDNIGFRDFIKYAGKVAFDYLQFGKVLTDPDISSNFNNAPQNSAQVEETPSNPDCLSDPLSNPLLRSGLFVRHRKGIITVAHSSLGVFLGALYYILYLEESELDESGELFFYFCIELLRNQSYFPLLKGESIHRILRLHVRGRIDVVQLDLHDIGMLYPVLDISLAHKNKDELVLQFLLEVLSDCKNVKEIFLGSDHPVERVLSSVKSVWAELKRIQLGTFENSLDIDVVRDIGYDGLDVVIDNQEGTALDELLKVLQTSERTYSIYFLGGGKSKPMIDFSLFARGQIRKFYIHQRNNPCALLAIANIPLCSALNEIHMDKSRPGLSEQTKLDTTIINGLGKASEDEKLPNLTSMIINGHYRNVSQLFEYKWTALTRLALCNVELDETSTATLGGDILPSLVYLELVGNQPSLKFTELSQKMKRLQEICLGDVQYGNSNFAEAITKGCFPELQRIKINHPSRDIDKLLQALNGLNLTHFSLENGGSEINVANIAQNKAILSLKSLELRELRFRERNSYGLSELLSIKNKFPNLERLNLVGCGLIVHNVRCLAQIGAEGSLPVL